MIHVNQIVYESSPITHTSSWNANGNLAYIISHVVLVLVLGLLSIPLHFAGAVG